MSQRQDAKTQSQKNEKHWLIVHAETLPLDARGLLHSPQDELAYLLIGALRGLVDRPAILGGRKTRDLVELIKAHQETEAILKYRIDAVPAKAA